MVRHWGEALRAKRQSRNATPVPLIQYFPGEFVLYRRTPTAEIPMASAESIVSIPTPARYMVRLCNHFAHRVSVQREADHARIEFPNAPCGLQVVENGLQMRIESDDLAAVQRLQEVVGRHLKQVASGEMFEVDWRTA